MTSRLNVASIRKQRDSLIYLDYDLDMLSMGVCTTRQWVTSGRLVQELNACTAVEIQSSQIRARCNINETKFRTLHVRICTISDKAGVNTLWAAGYDHFSQMYG